jgi:hypothetical protein
MPVLHIDASAQNRHPAAIHCREFASPKMDDDLIVWWYLDLEESLVDLVILRACASFPGILFVRGFNEHR